MRWSREVEMTLRAQRGWKYITRKESEPKNGTPEKSKWNDANNQIVGALGTAVEALLQRALEAIMNAKLAWDKLKEKTYSKGVIVKLEALTSAIQNHVTLTVPASTTITEIKHTLSLCSRVQHPHKKNGW